jgi:transposase
LAGPPHTHFTEPNDHGLGRSRGGFTSKVNLVCDSNGTILAIWVTAGQCHESQAFEEVMGRAQRPRRSGQPRWPDQGVGDKGYSYARVRSWVRRRHIEPVIPTRKDQPREARFDKASYRRRNIIERAIGWFKWCRALATRYDKLAVNYVALWMIANIQFLLRKVERELEIELSETT